MAKYKEDIMRLRAEGKSYREIQSELGCSKGTIAYHLGEGQKEKTYAATVERRKRFGASGKVETFNRDPKEPKRIHGEFVDDPREVIRNKVNNFQRKGEVDSADSFTLKEFYEKFEDVDTCYLTGRPINFENPRTYQLDHIVPKKLGGTNSIDNCGITTPEANCAKGYQTLEEFLTLCYDVLVHWEVIEIPKEKQ